jgi:hypothetical protein
MRLEARKTLDLAILIALELDMNKRDFARIHGEGDPVLEESWRRTWYILSITDQHFAIVVNCPIYQLANIASDVELPCDDEFYEAGVSQLHQYRCMTNNTANTSTCNLPGVWRSRVCRPRGSILLYSISS